LILRKAFSPGGRLSSLALRRKSCKPKTVVPGRICQNKHVNAQRLTTSLGTCRVKVRRVGVNLGAEISGVDLRMPLSDEQFHAIDDALVENELIIFRDQDITSEQLMAFGRRFGMLTVHPFAPNEGKNAPELIKFRNDETTPPFGTDVWHSDETFRTEPPMATILCAKEVPAVGGDTMFASMTAAFDGLSDRMQQFISGLEAIHDMKPFRPLFGESEEDRKKLQRFELMYPPQVHPVVRVHPVSGRKVFVNHSSRLPLRRGRARQLFHTRQLLHGTVAGPGGGVSFRHHWATTRDVDNRSTQRTRARLSQRRYMEGDDQRPVRVPRADAASMHSSRCETTSMHGLKPHRPAGKEENIVHTVNKPSAFGPGFVWVMRTSEACRAVNILLQS
jgi:taurine dioxygenase